MHSSTIGIPIHSSCQADSHALSTRQRDLSLADLRCIACRKDGKVRLEAADAQDASVALGVEGAAQGDVLAEGRVEEPRLLRKEGDGAAERGGAGEADHLTEERGEEG